MQKSLFIAKSLRKMGLLKGDWLRPFNFTLSKSLNNKTFKVPVLKNIGWSIIFENEHWMTEIVEILLPLNHGIFVDVGVNIGQTLLKFKSLDKHREYFGFEVNPSCIAYLNELIKVNDFSNVNLMPFGLSDKTGVTKLQFYHNNDVDVTASIISNYRPDDKVVKSEYVISSRFDDLEIFSNTKVGIIKIDVEGAELEVISGGEKLISNNRSAIIIEILPAYSDTNKDRMNRQKQIESIFKDLNYVFFLVEKDDQNHFKKFRKVDSFLINKDISQCDYLLIPEEKADQVSLLRADSNTL